MFACEGCDSSACLDNERRGKRKRLKTLGKWGEVGILIG